MKITGFIQNIFSGKVGGQQELSGDFWDLFFLLFSNRSLEEGLVENELAFQRPENGLPEEKERADSSNLFVKKEESEQQKGEPFLGLPLPLPLEVFSGELLAGEPPKVIEDLPFLKTLPYREVNIPFQKTQEIPKDLNDQEFDNPLLQKETTKEEVSIIEETNKEETPKEKINPGEINIDLSSKFEPKIKEKNQKLPANFKEKTKEIDLFSQESKTIKEKTSQENINKTGKTWLHNHKDTEYISANLRTEKQEKTSDTNNRNQEIILKNQKDILAIENKETNMNTQTKDAQLEKENEIKPANLNIKTNKKEKFKDKTDRIEKNKNFKHLETPEKEFEIKNNHLQHKIQKTEKTENISSIELPEFVKELIIKTGQQGKHEALVKLHPPELGELHVSVSIDRGEVKLILTVEHTKTAETISQHLQQLETAIENLGLQFGGAEINLAGQQSFAEQQKQNLFTSESSSTNEEKNQESIKEIRNSSSLIDIRI